MVGRQIAQFQILEKVGEGGMGVVWKARDTRLNRLVALKLLPPEKTNDRARRQRFIQEAQAASALNHPNIITIYDINEANGDHFIAMEFVPGRPLEEIINDGPLRPSETLKLAIQIADSLAAAHGAGIIHRDIKPANILVTPAGQVKVLDFGLAKLTDLPEEPVGDRTRTLAITSPGVVLGSFPYMSPEQAEGKKVDGRSDIFSFGAVLYEMVTGRRAFHGDSAASTLAAVLEREPQPASEIVPTVSPELERLIGRCLRKDVSKRAQHMDDLRIALEEIKEEWELGARTPGSQAKPVQRSRWWIWATACLAFIGAGLLTATLLNRREGKHANAPDTPITPVNLTTYRGWETQPTFSPDGSQVAFAWEPEGEHRGIYVKYVGSDPPLRITASDTVSDSPAWSPDGRAIAYIHHGKGSEYELRTVSPLGGADRRLNAAELTAKTVTFPPSWTPDSRWIVYPGPEGLLIIPATGGPPQRFLESPPEAHDHSIAFSPDGRSLAVSRHLSTGPSHLLLIPVDAQFRVAGEARAIFRSPNYISSVAWSPAGETLVFATAGSHGQGSSALFRVDAGGGAEPRSLAALGTFTRDPVFSRQGGRFAYAREIADSDIWQIDASGRSARSPVSSTLREANPKLSPDGSRVAFASSRSGTQQVWVCGMRGTACSQVTSFAGELPRTPRWSPDGKLLTLAVQDHQGRHDIYIVDAEGGTPRRMTSLGSAEGPSFSHDGRWIYYRDVSLKNAELFKVALGEPGAKPVQVTRNGGSTGYESADGKTLWFVKSARAGPLYRMPLDDPSAPEERVAEGVQFEAFEAVGDGVYYIAAEGESFTLYHLPRPGARARKIARVDGPLDFGLGVSPDGKTFLYSKVVNSGTDLMLVENYR